MIRKAVIFLLVLLCMRVSSKICTTSTLNGIASGIATIITLKNQSQTSYSVPLSGFNLGNTATIFQAITIAGFQTPTSQQFYSLVVSEVSFTNSNTQMNFTVNYFYSGNGTAYRTVWSQVKLSWFASSTLFETVVNGDSLGGSYLWAGTAEVYAPFNQVSGPVFDNSTFIPQTTEMSNSPACGFINNITGYFDLFCNGQANSRFLTHSYIMGFQFEPSVNYTIAAATLQGGGSKTLEDRDQALSTASFTFIDETAGGGGAIETFTGPKLLVKGFEGQLKYIKIAIVITVILDISFFPNFNSSTFEYSGVYMSYSQLNKPQSIKQAFSVFSQRVEGSQNYNYYSLMTSQYQIFGLSSFEIAAVSSNTTSISYNIFFDSIDSVFFQTDNLALFSNIVIAKDSWNSITNKCFPQTKTINNANIQQQILTSIPSVKANQQTISVVSQQGTYSNFIYQYFAAPIGNSSTPLSQKTTFTNTLLFKNITAGWSSQLKFTLTNFNINTTGYSVTTDLPITYEVWVQDVLVLAQNKTPTLSADAVNDVWNEAVSLTFKSSSPNVTFVLLQPRDPQNDLLFHSELSITQLETITYTCALGLTYNVISKTCQGCPVGCINCNSYICSDCISGYFYSFNTSTIVRCNKCSSVCLTCQSISNCSTCQSGYTLQNQSCIFIAPITPNQTSQQKSGPPLGIIIPIIIVGIVVIVTIVIIYLKRKKDLANSGKDDNPIDTVGSRGTMDHLSKVQWAKVNQQIFKLDSDCSSCRTVPGNTIISCGHNYHLGCLGQWFKSNLQCNKCHKTVSGDVTVVCIRCKQYYFKKPLAEAINLYEQQFQICDECYREKLKGTIKRHLEIQLVPEEIIIEQ